VLAISHLDCQTS